jgi:cytosine/creatinine deaminase
LSARIYDLVLANANIEDGLPLRDIGIGQGGKILEIGSHLTGKEVVDVAGDVVVPSFIESHIHLGKALLDKMMATEPDGTLASAIRITGELKRGFRYDEVLARSKRVIEMLVSHGTTTIRVHPDTDPVGGLMEFKVMLQLRNDLAGTVDIQVVAFPQEGIVGTRGALEMIEEAIRLGADVVGGCPYNEIDAAGTRKQVDLLFDLAKRYDKDLDFHADLGDDVNDLRYRAIDHIMDATEREGYQGRVTVGHMTSLSSVEPEVLEETIARMAKDRINLVPLPATDLFLSGRGDKSRVRRGVLNPMPFLRGGVNVAISSNNIRNGYTPFGNGDLLLIGYLYGHAAQLASNDDRRALLDMITTNPAKILGIQDSYGLAVGRNADLVVLGTKALSDIFLDIPVRKYVLKRGRIVYRSELVETKGWT